MRTVQEVLDRIDLLASRPAGEYDVSSIAVLPIVATRFKDLAELISRYDYHVFPSGDGGLRIEWDDEERIYLAASDGPDLFLMNALRDSREAGDVEEYEGVYDHELLEMFLRSGGDLSVVNYRLLGT